MAVISYDATAGRNLFEAATDFLSMDNAADPASHDPKIHSAAAQAEVRDFCQYVRGGDVIGNSKKIWGVDVATSASTPLQGHILQYDATAAAWVNQSAASGVHNDLTGIQGGSTGGGYYHSTSAEYSELQQLLTNTVSDTTGDVAFSSVTITPTSGTLNLGGHAIDDVFISSDGTSSADDTLVTAGWVSTHFLGSGGTGGATAFTGLTDTPSSYASQANKLVHVNSTPDALEFVDNLTYDTATSLLSITGDIQLNDTATEIKTDATNKAVFIYADSNGSSGGTIALRGSTYGSLPGSAMIIAKGAGDVIAQCSTNDGSSGFVVYDLAGSEVAEIDSDGLGKFDLVKLTAASPNITLDTSDGSDSKSLSIGAAGAVGATRSGHVAMYGNEHATRSGYVDIVAGDATGSKITLTGAIETQGTASTLTLQGALNLGGHSIDDVLISTDGASTADDVFVTPGWIDANVSGGGGSVAGTDTQIQFNDSGSFGASSGFTYDDTTKVFSVTGASASIRLSTGASINSSRIALNDQSNTRWSFGKEGSSNDHDFTIYRYNSSGVYQDTPITIDAGNGSVLFAASSADGSTDIINGQDSGGVEVFAVDSDGNIDAASINTSSTTGGSGSAGSGNQYVTLNINGTNYKLLHDGTA